MLLAETAFQVNPFTDVPDYHVAGSLAQVPPGPSVSPVTHMLRTHNMELWHSKRQWVCLFRRKSWFVRRLRVLWKVFAGGEGNG